MHDTRTDPPPTSVGTGPGAEWHRVAPCAGWVGAVALLVGALLFLVDAAGVLAPWPEFRSTTAGFEADLATYYVAYLERQHDVLWAVVVRDSLLPLGFLALMVLFLAAGALVGWRRPVAQLAALLCVVGGVLQIVSDTVFLGQVAVWRQDGWPADPPGPVVALGRSSDAVDLATGYVEAAGFVVLAGALVCLALLVRGRPDLPGWLGWLASAEAVGMLVLVVGRALESDLVFQVGALATGVAVGPALFASLGHHLGRAARDH
ncbi:hypothetical protein SAMN04488543_1640 [Friedmanniella luteola]|uniref:Uncharacterized protein n=1 Tax=Friedmanniella luteola TaxID=546871 RepID=A0A1H1RT50_9ACTN|nr:hypothetical protein [Friedmanniella luteola]SDS38854.1 hypothetical protein SAMN04488543_1640 [Friedmanniella luteola]